MSFYVSFSVPIGRAEGGKREREREREEEEEEEEEEEAKKKSERAKAGFFVAAPKSTPAFSSTRIALS
jgi:CO dehydrogenase/acetyl-CoA synthase beta subunit